MALDGNVTTAWNEGGSGSGTGEWIELKANSAQTVSGIRIMPGFCNNEPNYYRNCRPKDITITFSDGTYTTTTLSDSYYVYQDLQFDREVTTSSIRITVNSVYSGNKYQDCCISEIQVY